MNQRERVSVQNKFNFLSTILEQKELKQKQKNSVKMVLDQRVVVPDYVSKTFIENALRKAFSSRDLILKNIRLEMGTSVGDNYCSDIYRAYVKYSKTPESKTEEERSLVIKSMPFTELRGPVLDELEVFDKEIDMYTDTLQRLSKLVDGELFCAK